LEFKEDFKEQRRKQGEEGRKTIFSKVRLKSTTELLGF